jgi:hypothetical protein
MSDTTVRPGPAATRRARPVVATLGAILAAAGAFLLPFLVYAAKTTDTDSTPAIDFVSDIIVVWFGLVPLGLGLWLLYIGAPALPSVLRARASSLATRDLWLRVGGWLLSSSIGRAVAATIVTVGAALMLPRGTRWLGAFAAITGYSVVDPVMNAFRPAWWLHTAQSVAGWVVLLIACGAISEIDKLGEGSMVFLAPVMLYPMALGLSGLVRLTRWLMDRG